jgi:drug/metabolite transporter (DMT)-like permease
MGAVSLRSPSSFVQLARQKFWLLGTLALLAGYVCQAVALDNGQLAVIQPLLVTTIVFALPLGYFLTQQNVNRAQIVAVNPLICILIGTPFLAERLAEPTWHKVVAYAGLALALVAAVTITRATEGAREAESPRGSSQPDDDPFAAAA